MSVACRCRWDISSTSLHVPMTNVLGYLVSPTELHEGNPVSEFVWYLGGPINVSLLKGIHIIRLGIFGRERVRERKILFVYYILFFSVYNFS